MLPKPPEVYGEELDISGIPTAYFCGILLDIYEMLVLIINTFPGTLESITLQNTAVSYSFGLYNRTIAHQFTQYWDRGRGTMSDECITMIRELTPICRCINVICPDHRISAWLTGGYNYVPNRMNMGQKYLQLLGESLQRDFGVTDTSTALWRQHQRGAYTYKSHYSNV